MIKVEISNSGIKFLNKLDSKSKSLIIEKIKLIKNSLEETGILPYKSIDFKSLKGDWYPYKRMHIGDFRVIFHIDF